MEGKNVLVVDFGTSKVRVNLVNTADGSFLDSSAREYQMISSKDGITELDVNEMWDAVVSCVEDVVNSMGKNRKAEAISFSYFGDNLILADFDGNPLTNCILCFDARGKKEAEDINNALTEEWLIQTIGSPYTYMSTGAKILWMKRNNPEIFKKTAYFFTIQQFVNQKLGLEYVNDRTMAARKLMFDTEKDCWAEELLKLIGIQEESLGKVLPTDSVIGKIRRFGTVEFTEEVPVILGGHDCDLGIIGLGVGDEKEPVIADITGTYDHLAYLARGNLNLKKRRPEGKIESYSGPLENTSVCIGAFTTSGALLEWFMKEIVGDTKPSAYRKLWDQMKFDGESTLKVIPDFAGNHGRIEGLGLGIKQSDLFKAIIEALTMKSKEIIDELTALKEHGVEKVRIGGGAANSPEWIQLRADLTGLTFERMENIQVSALGAAVLAACATGIYKNIGDAVSHMVKVEKIYLPNMQLHEKYQALSMKALGEESQGILKFC